METATKPLKNLFVELVKIELSNYSKLSKNIVSNTIQHFAELIPFNTISKEEWEQICFNDGIKSNC
jgi:hypothetical protein